jgi:hypothetical protein
MLRSCAQQQDRKKRETQKRSMKESDGSGQRLLPWQRHPER